jgi:uncharacterized protein with FMN-binding domain
MAKRMGKGLVVLSSAAIAAVYGVGYAVTQPAAISMAAGVAPAGDAPSASGTAAGTASTGANSNGNGAAAPSAAGSASSSASASPAGSGLTDGTYTGTGWSRHGSVTISVTVQGGKITAAPITSVTTRYSQSVIAGLPAKVLAAQTANVQLVSGATDSSTAYRSALTQALGQAGGASTTSTSNGSVQVTSPSGVIYQNPGTQSTGTGGQAPTGSRRGNRGSFGY